MILFYALILSTLMIMVMLTDITRYIIPNWVVLLLLLLYPAVYYFGTVPDWYWSLALGLGMMMIGFALFAFRIMGGGDVKLLAVTAIYAGLSGFPVFIMWVALLGGGLALMLLILRSFAPAFAGWRTPPLILPRVLTHGEPVPYGVAIAIAFLLLLWSGRVPGLAL